MMKTIGICLTTAAILAAGAQGASARSWSYVGRRGGTWTRTVTPYHNGGGNFGRTVTTTRPNGRTATGSFSRSVNDGTITDTRSYTGFGGRTKSETLTRTPGEGGEVSYTGRGGNTYTRTFGP